MDPLLLVVAGCSGVLGALLMFALMLRYERKALLKNEESSDREKEKEAPYREVEERTPKKKPEEEEGYGAGFGQQFHYVSKIIITNGQVTEVTVLDEAQQKAIDEVFEASDRMFEASDEVFRKMDEVHKRMRNAKPGK